MDWSDRTKREAETYLRDVIHERVGRARRPRQGRRRCRRRAHEAPPALQRKRSPQRLATHACRSVKAITTDAGSRTPRSQRSECRG
jgi:hypothetical protein